MEQIITIRAHALKLLTGRMYSREELSKKLVKKFPGEQEQILKILKELTEGKFLDDTAYAETYVQLRQSGAPRGKFSLRMELKKKGIAEKIIQKVLSEISDEKEEQLLVDLLEKKIRTFPQDLSKKQQKEKLFRFLTSRGFPPSNVLRVLEQKL